MIERMEVSSPPGVFMVIRIRLACSSLAWSIPWTIYSARIGSISPSMCSSTTVELRVRCGWRRRGERSRKSERQCYRKG